MIERRREKRFKKKLMITTMFRDESGNIVTEDSIYCDDISASGARLVCPHKIPKGKLLDLRVFLFSDPIHLPAQGKVVWSEKKQTLELVKGKKKQDDDEMYWVGIQFINIDVFSRERIIRLLDKGIENEEEY